MHECRICFESSDDLISPCDCSGNLKWVHSDCLVNWRKKRAVSNRHNKCEVCNANYNVVLELSDLELAMEYTDVLRELIEQIQQMNNDSDDSEDDEFIDISRVELNEQRIRENMRVILSNNVPEITPERSHSPSFMRPF